MLHSLFIVELREQQEQDSTDFTCQFVSLCSSINAAIRLCRSYDPRLAQSATPEEPQALQYWFAILETTVDPPVPEIATRLITCVSKEGTLTNYQPGTQDGHEGDRENWLKSFDHLL